MNKAKSMHQQGCQWWHAKGDNPITGVNGDLILPKGRNMGILKRSPKIKLNRLGTNQILQATKFNLKLKAA